MEELSNESRAIIEVYDHKIDVLNVEIRRLRNVIREANDALRGPILEVDKAKRVLQEAAL